MKINFTPEVRDALRKEYEAAVERGDENFEFRDFPFVTEYAKYLLEFLDDVYQRKAKGITL